jgi:hypothetical protein
VGGARHVWGGGLSPSEQGNDGRQNQDDAMGILNGSSASAVDGDSGVHLQQGEAKG